MQRAKQKSEKAKTPSKKQTEAEKATAKANRNCTVLYACLRRAERRTQQQRRVMSAPQS